jgi:phosphoribosylformimino-5-aminoimidazole carboxamide ribotide isomerase
MSFEVIPVIDLKAGKAVRAVAGDRAEYRPLATPLCPDGDVLKCIAGYLGLYPFKRLYVADLDAIQAGARQDAPLQAIRTAFPQLDLWVDAGFRSAHAAQEWAGLGLGHPVLGSESLTDARAVSTGGAILSLDFRGDRFLGQPALLANPETWPGDVIVMCLHDVGMGGGPDMARLASAIEAADDRRIFAAGGVRNLADLQGLAALGASGALIASALHSGAITSADLERSPILPHREKPEAPC